MPLPALVTVSEFADWVGDTIADDDARVIAWIRAASTLVRSATGRAWVVDDDGTLDSDDPEIDDDDLEVAQTVVRQVVERKWRNPAGVIQEATGPFSTRYADGAAEGIYLTATEREMLGTYATASRPGLWTIRTTRTTIGDTVYLDVEGGSQIPFMESPEQW